MSSSTVSVIKTLIVPAVISLILFLVFTFAVVPVWRRYRNRYSQYLPLDAISNQTSSLRYRITNRLASLTLPSAWSRERHVAFAGGELPDADLGDGEELEDVDEVMSRVLGRLASSGRPDNDRRLSRDLEEGFIDDSDEEADR